MVSIPAHYQRSFENIRSSGDLNQSLRQLKFALNDQPSPQNDIVNITNPILRILLIRVCHHLDNIIRSETAKVQMKDLDTIDSIASNLFLAHYLFDIEKTAIGNEIKATQASQQKHTVSLRAFKKDHQDLVEIERCVAQIESCLDQHSQLNIENLVPESARERTDTNIAKLLYHFQDFLDNATPGVADSVHHSIFSEVDEDELDEDIEPGDMQTANDSKQDEIYAQFTHDLECMIRMCPEITNILVKWLDKAKKPGSVPITTGCFTSIALNLVSCADTKLADDFAELLEDIPEIFEQDQDLVNIAIDLNKICPEKDLNIFKDEALSKLAFEAIENCPPFELEGLCSDLASIRSGFEEYEDEDGKIHPGPLEGEDLSHFFHEGIEQRPEFLWKSFSEICSNFDLGSEDDDARMA